MNKPYLAILFLFILSLSKAQDPIYSNYFANPMMLNPAFAGNNYDGRLVVNYRLQWPGASAVYNTFSGGFDRFSESTNLAFGFNLVSDDAGKGTLKSNKASAIIGYRVKVTDDTYIKGGVDLGYARRSLAWEKLIFLDAIQSSGGLTPGGTILPSSEINPNNYNRDFFDIGSGLLFYNSKYYLGISADHLNTPPDAYLTDLRQNYIGVPILWSIHGGYQLELDRLPIENYPTFITPHFLIARQASFNQFNLGVNGAWDVFTAGLGYRISEITGDAVLFNVGLRWENYRASYNFDLTVSNISLRPGGAHEVNMSYLFGGKKKSKINDCFKLFE